MLDPMDYQTYSGGDPAGWLMSEKLDGVRARWDGARLLTKGGHVIHAPDWFTTGLPGAAVEGELYLGRRGQSWVSGLARRGPRNAAAGDWGNVRFWLFDAPDHARGFAERLAWLQGLALPGHVDVVAHEVCIDRADLAARFAAVVAAGGEGLVLRHPHGRYASGERSPVVLKVKQHPDTPFLLGYSGEAFFATRMDL